MLHKYFIGLIMNLVPSESSVASDLRNWVSFHSVQGASKLTGFSAQDPQVSLFMYSCISLIQKILIRCSLWDVGTNGGEVMTLQ